MESVEISMLDLSVKLLSDDGVLDVGVDEFVPDSESMFDQTPPVFDRTPPIRDIGTPNLSLQSSSSENDSQSSLSDSSANNILKDIRIKNVNRLIIGTLNINFIAPKFEQLKEVIGNHLDIFTIQETKIDESFPDDQFEIEGYHKPYRLDRSKHGVGF